MFILIIALLMCLFLALLLIATIKNISRGKYFVSLFFMQLLILAISGSALDGGVLSEFLMIQFLLQDLYLLVRLRILPRIFHFNVKKISKIKGYFIVFSAVYTVIYTFFLEVYFCMI